MFVIPVVISKIGQNRQLFSCFGFVLISALDSVASKYNEDHHYDNVYFNKGLL